MEYRTRLHQCLDESRVACGVFSGSNSPELIELLVERTDIDFMGIDLQHSAIGVVDSVHLLRAVQASNPRVTPIVRLPCHEVYWIQQTLDAGYAGLIVPLVESAEQAKKLVRATYYPPVGDRSYAGNIRSSMYGLDFNSANQSMILLPQIESKRGLENLEEIVAVDGITGLLLGPVDLSLSCGWTCKDLWSHQPFLDAAAAVVTACRNTGKQAAILTPGFEQSRDAGFNIIGFGGEVSVVRVDASAKFNKAASVIRRENNRAPVGETNKPTVDENQRRIEAYRASIQRFDQFIEANYDKHGGNWPHARSADGYFSLIAYANYVGRRDLSLQALRYVGQHFVDTDVPLKQNPNRNQMMTYVPSWLGWGAVEAEAFELGGRWLDYVAKFQDRTSGGFFAGLPQLANGRGALDFDSTTMSTIAFAKTGRKEASVKAGDFLLRLCQAQPDPSNQFYTAWNEPDGLVTSGDECAITTVLRWAEPQQHYYKMGLLILALANVHGVTGDRKYLDTAVEWYDHTIRHAVDLWTNTISHKMCWASTTLYAITGENKYVQDSCRFADHLVTLQQSDGSFIYPEFWPTCPPPQWESIPNASAQFTLWITRTLRTLEAG